MPCQPATWACCPGHDSQACSDPAPPCGQSRTQELGRNSPEGEATHFIDTCVLILLLGAFSTETRDRQTQGALGLRAGGKEGWRAEPASGTEGQVEVSVREGFLDEVSPAREKIVKASEQKSPEQWE